MLKNFYKNLLLKKGVRNDAFLDRLPFYDHIFKEIIIAVETEALLKSQYWPKDLIENIQWLRIKNLCEKSYKRIKFWEERFKISGISPHNMKGWKDFRRLQVIRKTDFKNLPVKHYTEPRLFDRGWRERKTSGSTAEPFVFYTDRYHQRRGPALFRRLLVRITGESDIPVIVADSRRSFADKNTHWFYIGSFQEIKNNFENLVALSNKIGPSVLYTFPSYAKELARLCGERKTDLRLAGVIVTGEALTKEQKKFGESAFKAKIFECYGISETGWIACGCEYGKMHINSESDLVEITDDNGKPLKEGEQGQIVITGFDNEIMPFIRYATGDLGVLKSGTCLCGGTLPTLEFIGREGEMIPIGENMEIPFIDFLGIFERRHLYIRQYRLVQEKRDSFTVKIVPEKEFSDSEKKGLIAELEKKFLLPVHIKIEITDRLAAGPNNKAIYFESHLKNV